MWYDAISVYLLLLPERDHTVVAFGNEARYIFCSVRTFYCGRHLAGDMKTASERWKCQIWKLLFLVVWCLGDACERVPRFLPSEGGLSYILMLHVAAWDRCDSWSWTHFEAS